MVPPSDPHTKAGFHVCDFNPCNAFITRMGSVLTQHVINAGFSHAMGLKTHTWKAVPYVSYCNHLEFCGHGTRNWQIVRNNSVHLHKCWEIKKLHD